MEKDINVGSVQTQGGGESAECVRHGTEEGPWAYRNLFPGSVT